MSKRSVQVAPARGPNRFFTFGLGALILLAVLWLVVRPYFGADAAGATAGGDITIEKSAVTTTVQFIPYQVGNVKMEVLAVRATDGSIRTAFNTCQVCYNSGRGYYKQEGDELVCQNCGNRFNSDEVEVQIGGCNPVPILEADKSDDGSSIVIPQQFLEKNKGLFKKWKKA